MTCSRSARRAVSLLALSLLLSACSVDSQAQQPAPASAAAAAAAAPAQVNTVPASSPAAVAALPNFAPLVTKFGPAVVNVDVVQSAQQNPGAGGQGDDPFGDFFRRFGIPGPEGRGGPQPPQRGSGSGFIV